MDANEILTGLLDQKPERKASILVTALQQVFLEIDEEDRKNLLFELTATDSRDKVSSMVHL